MTSDNFYQIISVIGRIIKLEEQIVSITIVTKGEKCEMRDEEIITWYQNNIAKMFNPQYGTPEITVTLKRNDY